MKYILIYPNGEFDIRPDIGGHPSGPLLDMARASAVLHVADNVSVFKSRDAFPQEYLNGSR